MTELVTDCPLLFIFSKRFIRVHFNSIATQTINIRSLPRYKNNVWRRLFVYKINF